MQNIPTGTLVIVADGTKARMFHTEGQGAEMTLRQHDTLDAADIPLQGPSGSAPTQQTPQKNDERTFAKHIANKLNDGALKHEYAHLVIIADPQTLGELRPQLHKETQDRVVGELAKTLTNAPIADIQHALH
ncbi:host attachment family protein [Cognatilysobacter lacus]|uniref:Host attachment protein n=1 Tax=Cognatilysobacter lacus TaxID=1643323 RepID=A0A5D8Z622_9GAMM|nr:host attachment family protein [Lysobacter lacus]TZF90199.1 host attachment protein [Lysobacter lacus]